MDPSFIQVRTTSLLFIPLLIWAIFASCKTSEIIKPVAPTVDFDMINNHCTVSCEVSFVNKSKNTLSYRWEFGDGEFSEEEAPKHLYRKSGVFFVKLTATGPGQMSNSLQKTVTIGAANVTAVPPSFGFDPFYEKYIDASGIPVISSRKVPNEALIQARNIINQMVAKRPDIVAKMLQNKFRMAVMAQTEKTLDIPEHRDLQTAFPETDWNTRARGLGATLERPAASCAEENLLCYPNDPYIKEDITIHEFSHAMHIMGIRYVDKNFDQELEGIYKEAKTIGLWKDTYAMANYSEYFAEGVQCWFNQNEEAIPTNGIHNHINTRNELKEYDPNLYRLISRYFNEDDQKVSCH